MIPAVREHGAKSFRTSNDIHSKHVQAQNSESTRQTKDKKKHSSIQDALTRSRVEEPARLLNR
jgi:hypothetical protein